MSPSSTSRVPAPALWLARIVVATIGAALALGVAAYLFRRGNVPRFRLESATVAFVILGTLSHLLLNTNDVPAQRSLTSLRGEWGLWMLASIALYWPSLWLGPLSDDFVLVDRVRHNAFGLVHAEFFRPLPLMAWSVLLRTGTGWAGLHLLNVAMHGMVAFLASRLAAPYVSSRLAMIAAGMLVLAFPASVESVSWASGVFDVSATLLTLVAVLSSRRYAAQTSVATRVTMLLCALAALLCKETAVVIPLLIALDMWASHRWPRPLLWDEIVLTVLFGGVGFVRWLSASEMVRQPITKYVVQRWLFGTIGGLTVPWHRQVIDRWPFVAATGAVLVVGLSTAFFVMRTPRATTRVAAASLGWVLLGSLPAITFFFVAPDLQGSRYLYLPTVGFALLLVVMCQRESAFRTRGIAVVTMLTLLGAFGVRQHQRHWQAAAGTRDAIVNAARADATSRNCQMISVRELPETVAGAYVFRNGSELAFASEGLTLSAGAAPGCAFAWDSNRATLVPTP